MGWGRMLNKLGIVGKIVIFLFLTLLTQIGGLVYLLVLLLSKVFNWRSKPITFICFLFVYAMVSYATTYIAPIFGRHAIACSFSQTVALKTVHPIFCALNRHYVNQNLVVLLEKASSAVAKKYPKTQTLVLDSNFPFITGFPLLPHLSHDDGRKVDLAFYYMNREGKYLPSTMKSPIGYWGYTQPRINEVKPCANFDSPLSLRWDFDFLQTQLPDYRLEPKRTAYLINWLVGEGQKYGLEKVLLEPHLKSRLGLESDLTRFQGCRAARHDDHIHLQVK